MLLLLLLCYLIDDVILSWPFVYNIHVLNRHPWSFNWICTEKASPEPRIAWHHSGSAMLSLIIPSQRPESQSGLCLIRLRTSGNPTIFWSVHCLHLANSCWLQRTVCWFSNCRWSLLKERVHSFPGGLTSHPQTIYPRLRTCRLAFCGTPSPRWSPIETWHRHRSPSLSLCVIEDGRWMLFNCGKHIWMNILIKMR
jgi:hypothetical protein